MRYSIIVAFNNNYALMSNFMEHLLHNVDRSNGELILYSDGCKDRETLEYLSQKASEVPGLSCIYLRSRGGTVLLITLQ